MIKDFLCKTISNALGEFIEEFQAKDLNISSWNGVLSKQNLVLKSHAIEKLLLTEIGLNVKLVKGVIGNFYLKVPWTRIWKEPCMIKIENVHIYCQLSPEYNHEIKAKGHFDKKLAKLRDLEAIDKKHMKIKKTEEKTTKMKRMLQIIVENLILEVKNVHIRFEDFNSSPFQMRYSFGLTIDSVTLEPTNSKFERDFIDPEIRKKEKASYSKISVQGLSFYIDVYSKDIWNERPSFSNLSIEDFFDLSSECSERNDQLGTVLQKTTVVINKIARPESDIETDLAKSELKILIGAVNLDLEDQQFKKIYYILNYFDWHSQEADHFIYRPPYNIRPKYLISSRRWWDYAIKSVLMINKRRHEFKKFENIVSHARMRKEYILMYEIKIIHDIEEQTDDPNRERIFKPTTTIDISINADGSTLVSYEDMLSVLTDYEEKFQLEECLFYRQTAKNNLKGKEKESDGEKKNDREYMNQIVKKRILEVDKSTPKKTGGFFSNIVSKIKGRKQKEETRLEIDDKNIIENVEEFINDNNIFEKIDQSFQIKSCLSSLHLISDSISIKFKNRHTGSISFSFFNTQISKLDFLFLHFAHKDDIFLKIKDMNIIDDLTLNKRFVNILSFKPKKDEQSIDLALTIDQIPNKEKEINRYVINFKIAEVELVLNKLLIIRTNFFLKNPLSELHIENQSDYDLNTDKIADRIERKIKEKIIKNIGLYIRIELNVETSATRVILPDNANAVDSAYHLFMVEMVKMTTEDQESLGVDNYNISTKNIQIIKIKKAELNPENPTLFLDQGLVLGSIDLVDISAGKKVETDVLEIKLITRVKNTKIFWSQDLIKFVPIVIDQLKQKDTSIQNSELMQSIENSLKIGSSLRTSELINSKLQISKMRKESFHSFREDNDDDDFFEPFEELSEVLAAQKLIDFPIESSNAQPKSESKLRSIKSMQQISTMSYIRVISETSFDTIEAKVVLDDINKGFKNSISIIINDMGAKLYLSPHNLEVEASFINAEVNMAEITRTEIVTNIGTLKLKCPTKENKKVLFSKGKHETYVDVRLSDLELDLHSKFPEKLFELLDYRTPKIPNPDQPPEEPRVFILTTNSDKLILNLRGFNRDWARLTSGDVVFNLSEGYESTNL